MRTRSAFVLLAPLAALASASAQELVADKALEIELRASDPVLEGHGPSRTFEYDVTFDGTLHIWAASKDFDPILRITNSDGELLGEDDNTGGGTTAYIALEVSRNELPSITVAAADAGVTGKLVLHVSEAAETELTRSASREVLRWATDATAAARTGEIARAQEGFARSLGLLLAVEGGIPSPALAAAAEELGQRAFDAWNPKVARAAFERALEFRSRALPEDHPELLRTRGELANALAMLGELREARALFEQVLGAVLRTRPDDQKSANELRTGLATTIADLGELAAAHALLEQVLAYRLRTLPEDAPELQSARWNLANTLMALGDFESARRLYEQVFEAHLRTDRPDDPRLQQARGNLAIAVKAFGDLATARLLEEQALDVFERTLPDDHPDLQLARMNLGDTLTALGDHASALVLFERALAVGARTLPEDHPALLLAKSSVAGELRILGHLERARALYEQVLEVRSRALDHDDPDLQKVRVNLGALLCDLGETTRARELEEQALASMSRANADDGIYKQLARAYLALVLRQTGDLQGARALQERVLEAHARTRPDDDIYLQWARQSLALTIAAQEASSSSAKQAQKLGPREARPEEELGFRRLVDSFLRGLRRAASRTIAESSTREAEERSSSRGKDLGMLLSLADGLGVFESDPAAQREAFLLSEAMRSAALVSARLARGGRADPRYEGLRKRARDASEELARTVQTGAKPEAVARARAELESADRELVLLAAQLVGGPSNVLEPEFGALASKVGQGEALVAYLRYPRTTLERGAAARERSEVGLCAFVLRPDGALQKFELGPIDRIESAVESWREALGRTEGRGVGVGSTRVGDVRGRGEALRALVVDPLRESLVGVRRVVVALDDVLHAVPLDALPAGTPWRASGVGGASAIGSDAEVLGDALRIEMRASLLELLLEREPREGRSVLLALGGIDFDAREDPSSDSALAPEARGDRSGAEPMPGAALERGVLRGGAWERGFAALPATSAEVRELSAHFVVSDAGRSSDAIVLEGRVASRERLFELAANARFLHVATHGWFAPESILSIDDPEALGPRSRAGEPDEQAVVRGMRPMLLCGLALAGANASTVSGTRMRGLVTAEELATLDLAGCELAVLSACDTNVGVRRAGQGVASLQKALQMAGARSVITSLWKVPDEATKDLMVDFYRRLWVEKKPKSQALWEAKLKLRNAKDERGAPLYTTRDWAAWVLTGDPD